MSNNNTLTIRIKCRGAGELALSQLTPLQGRFKVLTEVNRLRLCRELIEDGYLEPISVWESGPVIYILNGHQRYEALLWLKDHGWTDSKGKKWSVKVPQIPVNFVEADSLADAKRKVLALASQYGSVSTHGLRALLHELDIDPVDVSLQFNFPEVDIAALMSGLEVPIIIGQDFEANPLLTSLDVSTLKPPAFESLQEMEDVPELPATPTAKFGDVYQLGRHRLMCGDSTDDVQVGQLMDGELADLVFTDPPYGVSYDGGHADPDKRREKLANDDSTEIYNKSVPLMFKFSKPTAALYLWFAATKSLQVLQVLQVLQTNDYVIRSWLIWNKNLAQFGAIGAQYKQKHEPCLYAYKKGETPFWDGPTNEVSVWDVDRASKNEFHPTQKPTDLAGRAMKNSCPSGGLVLDLFGGSGSTLVAAEGVGRRARLMELSAGYVDVIIKRWENHTGQKADRIAFQPETIRRPKP